MAFSISLDFRSFRDVSLYDVYDETGVYVFWNSASLSTPSYIGEGEVLSRFTQHLRKHWARRLVDGYIALIDGFPPAETKWRAVFGEMALLDICFDVFGRMPTHNRQDGKEGGVDALRRRLGTSHTKFKVKVDGLDPLVNPRHARATTKVITYEEDREGRYVYEHDWRRR